jgi:DNA-binding GntR family transcriptional regulator
MVDQLKPLTKKDYLLTAIKEAMFRGDISPGDRLTQRELAARFNTSVTPVREALMELQSEGIVAYSPHRGATVTTISPSEVYDMCLIRVMLEEIALERALPNLTDDDFKYLWKIHEATAKAYEDRDWVSQHKLDLQIHLCILNRADSPVLKEMIQFIWNKCVWYLLPAIYDRGFLISTEHEKLIELLEARNLPAATEVLRKHILGFGKFLQDHLELLDGTKGQ